MQKELPGLVALDASRGPCRRLWESEKAADVEKEERDVAMQCEGQSPIPCHRSAPGVGNADAFLHSPTVRGIILSVGPNKRARLLQEDSHHKSADAAGPTHVNEPPTQQQELISLPISKHSLQWPSAAGELQQQQQWHQPLIQQQQSAVNVTPGTASASIAALLPTAPRKRSWNGMPGAARSLKSVCKASRALQGMAPACAADLQDVRAWLTALEA
jgi:hypothetical protein